MAEALIPREARAEAHRQKVRRLGGAAMTTEELLEAADAVSKSAGQAIKADRNFWNK